MMGSRCAVTQTSDCASSLRAALPRRRDRTASGMFEDFFRFADEDDVDVVLAVAVVVVDAVFVVFGFP
jgi:hypothetical protein